MQEERGEIGSRWLAYGEIALLFFVHGAALAAWFVPLSAVLDAAGLGRMKALAYGASAVGALVSPLVFGAIADRHMAPARVLRWLGLATSAAMLMASVAILRGWGAWAVLGLIQVHALCSAPTWGLSCTIVFAQLRDAKREFGPIRAIATLGWMSGCWLVSSVGADRSAMAGVIGAMAWLGVVIVTFLLPHVEPPGSAVGLTLRQRFGLDALALLRNKDHRAVFVTAALVTVPLAAFYPYTPPHLASLGFQRTSAWMTLGQVTEILSMLMLAGMMTRWRLKWIFLVGLVCGVLRFAFCALDTRGWLLGGVLLHGSSFAMVFITAQIYLEERVDPAWRARAQALLTLMTGGLGNLAGYLGSGWWFAANAAGAGVTWTRFWLGLSLLVAVILGYFLVSYRGVGPGRRGV